MVLDFLFNYDAAHQMCTFLTIRSYAQLDFRTPPGFDRTRNAEIGNKDIRLKHLEEAFTSEHWLVRIYRVKKQENRQALDHKLRNIAAKQKYTSKKVQCPMTYFFTGNQDIFQL